MANLKIDSENLNLIAKVLKEYKLGAVEISSGDFKYRVENDNNVYKSVSKEKLRDLKMLKEIVSPITGMFYSSFSPEDKALVKIEQKICKGDILCVLESMKNFIEIKAEEDGIIKEICVENGAIIEYSKPLFKYIPA